MLSSLPPLFPHSPHTLWYHTLTTTTATHHQQQQQPPPSTPTPHAPPHQPPHNQNRPLNPQRTLLSILHADENALQVRKANIRRYGAAWLRPPGVGKTLQGMADERVEREEVEAARGREEMEALVAAQVEGGIEGMGMGEEEIGGAERDLDGDIPDADADGEEGEGEGGWMSEDEDGAGLLEDEGMGLEEGADLDDEVPEGEEGSYEHTDTEVEDASSGEEGGVGGGSGSGRGPRLATFNTRTGEVVRMPGGGAGVGGGGLLGSSVFGNGGGNGGGGGSVAAPRFSGRRGAFGGMAPGLGEN